MSSYGAPPPPGPPAAYGPRVLLPAPAYPFAEPHTYPRLLRTPTWAWWRAVVGIVTLAVGVFVVAAVVTLPLLALAVLVQSRLQHQDFGQAFSVAMKLERASPASLLWLNLTLASGILIAFALVRWLHHLRPRWLTSVRPGMRWRFFAGCLGLAVIALAAQLVLAAFLPDPGGSGEHVTGPVNRLDGTSLAFALVILLTTPLQAIGEEYVFRGYLMQAFGSLFNASTAILATSLLFALAHGLQNAPLFLDRFLFGLLAGYLVYRIGGLEAGFALHILNNFLAFGFALLFGTIGGALTVSGVSWWNLPLTLVQNGLYLVLVLLLARRMGLTSVTAPPPAEALGQPGPGGSPPIGDASV